MFRLTVTDSGGNPLNAETMPGADMRRVLRYQYHIDDAQIEFAMHVTEMNPGQPYDLGVWNDEGALQWSARLEKLKIN